MLRAMRASTRPALEIISGSALRLQTEKGNNVSEYKKSKRVDIVSSPTLTSIRAFQASNAVELALNPKKKAASGKKPSVSKKTSSSVKSAMKRSTSAKAQAISDDSDDLDFDDEDNDEVDEADLDDIVDAPKKMNLQKAQSSKPIRTAAPKELKPKEGANKAAKELDDIDEAAEEESPEDKEDEKLGQVSIDMQRQRLVQETMKRFKSQRSRSRDDQKAEEKIDGEFWPDRSVQIEIEFPSVSEEVVQGLADEGKIEFPDPIKAAKYLAKQRDRLKKEKELLDKIKDVPERVRRAVPVDELPIEEKAKAPAKLPETFTELGITNSALLRTLYSKWSIVKPTEPQAIAIPQVLDGKNVFIAAQTGTGKTLSFVLPLLQCLRELELKAKKEGGAFRRRGQRTRSLILVPTRELVEQTREVVKALIDSDDFKHYKVYGMAGGISHDKAEHAGFNNGVDILISTPDRVLHHLQSKHLTLDDTSFVVIDEADTMFSFEAIEKSLKTLLNLMDKAQEESLTPFQYQFIWASATVSKSVAQHIAKEWPDAVQAFAPGLHRSVDKLRQDFLFGAKGRFKERLLKDTLKKYKDIRTMIFCNSGERVKYVFNILSEMKVKATYVTSDLLAKKRQSNFSEFADGKVSILVTTDFASRGIDTKARVDHVILYDFPTNVIDYLHRIGRTARANNEGFVTAFVGSEDQALVQRIRDSYERGRSMANIRAVPSFKQIKETIKSQQKKATRDHRSEVVDPKYLDERGKLKPIEAVEEL